MGVRIWHQSFTVLGDLPGYTAALKKRIGEVCRPDTEVVMHGQIPGTYTTDYPGVDLAFSFLYWIHGLQWVAAAREAQRQKFDVMVMANLPCPMIREIRTLVDIPVVGYGESAFNLGGLYGRRIGMLFFNTERRDFWPEQARLWGVAERYVGIEHAGVKFAEVGLAFTDERLRQNLIDRIVEQGKKLIADTGADVIVPGEMPLNLLMSICGVTEIKGATVWDGIAMSFKFAEMMVEFNKVSGMRPSRNSFFHAVPDPGRVEQVLKFYGLDRLGERIPPSS